MQNQYAARRSRLRRLIRKTGADAILVTNQTNVTYLTGFTGDSSYLLLDAKKLAMMISDTRYTTQIAEECAGLDAEIRDASMSMIDLVGRVCKTAKLISLAIESDTVTKSEFDQLDARLDGVQLVDSTGLVQGLRAIKDRQEIAAIETAIHMAQRAFEVIRNQLRCDQTEAEIGHNLEHQIRAFGGDRCAFDPIVGVGSRSALPHAVKTNRTIGESPFVLIDWGARAGQYVSDLTRILVWGKVPARFEKIYNVVLKAQMAAIARIKPGAKLRDVDRAARATIERAGFGRKFGHGLGHGIGLDVHEAPRLAPVSTGELKTGMVVTVEPGIYLEGWGGVRIEDDVLVTNDGHRVLSSLPKDFESCRVPL